MVATTRDPASVLADKRRASAGEDQEVEAVPGGAEALAEKAPSDRRGRVPPIDRWRLRFVEADVERAYQAETEPRLANLMRLAFCLGLGMFCLFGVLDTYLAPGYLDDVFRVRFLIGAPVIAAFVALSFSNLIVTHRQLIVGGLTLVTCLLVIALQHQMPMPEAQYYFSGLPLVMFFSACLFRPRPLVVAGNGLIILAVYGAYGLNRSGMPLERVANDMWFLASFAIVGTLAAYAIELGLRDKFARDVALERELEAADALRRQAESANALKTRFLANVSHELRTPLNAINGFAAVLADENLDQLARQNYRRYGRDILNSGHHLLELINTVVDLSKAEAGSLQIANSEVAPGELVEQAVTMARGEDSRNKVRVATEVADGLPALQGDPTRLRQILVNLTANAIKFSPPGGTVTLSLRRREPGWLELAVTDEGPGMNESQVEEALQPFVQLQSPGGAGTDSVSGGGTGLGLPIALHLVHAHGGELAIDSRPRYGTTVRVRLPAAEGAARADQKKAGPEGPAGAP